MNNSEKSNASENSWLDRTIPKEAQLSILLVFKVALLIFFYNYVEFRDFSLDSTQNMAFVTVLGMFIHSVVMTVVMTTVNLFLIIAIVVNVRAICRIVKQN